LTNSYFSRWLKHVKTTNQVKSENQIVMLPIPSQKSPALHWAAVGCMEFNPYQSLMRQRTAVVAMVTLGDHQKVDIISV